MDLNKPGVGLSGYGPASLNCPISVTRGLLLWADLQTSGKAYSLATGQMIDMSTEIVDADGTRKSWGGQIVQAVANTARCSPGLGVLSEEARTNLCLWSSDFSHAAWVKTNGAVDADSHIVPDLSANTTCQLRATAGNATFIQDLGVVANASKPFSVYLKRKTGTGTVEITLDGGTAWTAVTISDSAWTRVTKVQTLTDPDVGIRIVTSGDEVLAWGAQLEHFEVYASSYIPTVDASATRTGENLRYDNTAEVHCAAAAGTIIVITTTSVIHGGSYWTCTAGVSADHHSFLLQDGKWRGFGKSGNVTQYDLKVANAITAGVPSVGALCWEPNDVRVYHDGGDEQQDVEATMPAALGTLLVGQWHTGGGQAFQHIAHLLTYDRALSAAEVLAVTRDLQRMIAA